jgi:hypothetical protein
MPPTQTTNRRFLAGPAEGPVLIVYYPPGKTLLPDGNWRDNVAVALSILQAVGDWRGVAVTIPRQVDVHGETVDVWELLAAGEWAVERLVPLRALTDAEDQQ